MSASRRPSWSSFRRPRVRDARSRVAIAASGLLASVSLHVLVVQAIVGGISARPHSNPTREGLGANVFGVPTEAVTTMFFVEDSSAAHSANEAMDEIASAGKLVQSLHVTIVSPDPSLDAAFRELEQDEHGAPRKEESLAEREAKAALFGGYLAQIQARIERAWMRPRSPIGADLFSCRLQIRQGPSGQVQEITLEECVGDSRWQLSLITAIQRASPFPAPPDPSLFAAAIELSFQSESFTASGSEQGFEPLMVSAAAANTN